MQILLGFRRTPPKGWGSFIQDTRVESLFGRNQTENLTSLVMKVLEVKWEERNDPN